MPEAVVTMLVNGTSLRSISGLYVADWNGLYTEAPYRGGNVTIPGMPGQMGADKLADVIPFDLPVTLAATSHSGLIAIITAVRALFSGNLNTLTRRLPTNTTGTTADTACNGDYLAGTALSRLNYTTGRTTLSFVNLDGEWA